VQASLGTGSQLFLIFHNRKASFLKSEQNYRKKIIESRLKI